MLMKKHMQQSGEEATSWPPLLTASEASKMTGLPVKYIQKLRRAGAIKSYLMSGGTVHRYYRDTLREHLGL